MRVLSLAEHVAKMKAATGGGVLDIIDGVASKKKGVNSPSNKSKSSHVSSHIPATLGQRKKPTDRDSDEAALVWQEYEDEEEEGRQDVEDYYYDGDEEVSESTFSGENFLYNFNQRHTDREEYSRIQPKVESRRMRLDAPSFRTSKTDPGVLQHLAKTEIRKRDYPLEKWVYDNNPRSRLLGRRQNSEEEEEEDYSISSTDQFIQNASKYGKYQVDNHSLTQYNNPFQRKEIDRYRLRGILPGSKGRSGGGGDDDDSDSESGIARWRSEDAGESDDDSTDVYSKEVEKAWDTSYDIRLDRKFKKSKNQEESASPSKKTHQSQTQSPTEEQQWAASAKHHQRHYHTSASREENDKLLNIVIEPVEEDDSLCSVEMSHYDPKNVQVLTHDQRLPGKGQDEVSYHKRRQNNSAYIATTSSRHKAKKGGGLMHKLSRPFSFGHKTRSYIPETYYQEGPLYLPRHARSVPTRNAGRTMSSISDSYDEEDEREFANETRFENEEEEMDENTYDGDDDDEICRHRRGARQQQGKTPTKRQQQQQKPKFRTRQSLRDDNSLLDIDSSDEDSSSFEASSSGYSSSGSSLSLEEQEKFRRKLRSEHRRWLRKNRRQQALRRLKAWWERSEEEGDRQDAVEKARGSFDDRGNNYEEDWGAPEDEEGKRKPKKDKQQTQDSSKSKNRSGLLKKLVRTRPKQKEELLPWEEDQVSTCQTTQKQGNWSSRALSFMRSPKRPKRSKRRTVDDLPFPKSDSFDESLLDDKYRDIMDGGMQRYQLRLHPSSRPGLAPRSNNFRNSVQGSNSSDGMSADESNHLGGSPTQTPGERGLSSKETGVTDSFRKLFTIPF